MVSRWQWWLVRIGLWMVPGSAVLATGSCSTAVQESVNQALQEFLVTAVTEVVQSMFTNGGVLTGA